MIPLPCPRVSVIGSRGASEHGLSEAGEITRLLVENSVAIISGLQWNRYRGAQNRHRMRRKTIAVLGIPLDRTYPKENSSLQEEIMMNHLAISQYPVGHKTTPKDFVLRNRTMAIISDATVIIEAGESSGSLHQGW